MGRNSSNQNLERGFAWLCEILHIRPYDKVLYTDFMCPDPDEQYWSITNVMCHMKYLHYLLYTLILVSMTFKIWKMHVTIPSTD